MTRLPSRVQGVDYRPEAIDDVRRLVIELRDAALEQAKFEWAVGLSHAIAYLADYRDLLPAQTRPSEGDDGTHRQEQNADRQGQVQDREQAQDSDQDQDQGNDEGDVHD